MVTCLKNKNIMESNTKTITVEAIIDAPIETVWKNWTSPQNIVMWNAASEDWHTTWAENDLRIDGEFCFRMEAKDGSVPLILEENMRKFK
jgi:uncharacterized protein YndB with AHSA1/START domain